MTTRQFLLSAWDWNPVVIGICLVTLFVYAKAAHWRLPARSLYFIGAVAVFFLTLASPVNALAGGYLFSAHMLQHLLLLLLIPPLLLLGLRIFDWKWLNVSGRHSSFRLHPFAAWLAGLSAMWVWHQRTLCDLATTTPAGRVIQIISLIVLGLLFWWPILGPQLAHRLPPLLGVVYLSSACVGCTILGILITFAPVGAVCPVFLHAADRLGILPLIREQWGISPARDQQAGGLMMWVPACGIYISGVIALLARWYRAGETSSAGPAAIAYEPAPVFSSGRATRRSA
jgi:cytochrome c oxidase assembly factor CtaG